jgi:transcriptional regulator with GAF, ATPase, and Fis domain
MDLSNYTNTEIDDLADKLPNSLESAEAADVLRKTQLSALESLASLLLREIEFLKLSEDRTLAFLQAEAGINLHEAVQNFEKGLIRSALIRTKGVQKKAAEMLGVKVTTLNVKIKRHNIVFNPLEEAA